MPGEFYIEGKQEKVTLKDLSAEVAALEAKLDDGTTGLAALKALLDDIEAKADKLAGLAPAGNGVVANWQSGTATSGNPGADLVSIGANDTRNKIHSLLINIGNLTVGAAVRIRMFMPVNGTERQVYNQTFIKGTDPDGLWIINGTIGLHEVLRVELHSDNAGDNGQTVDYDYMLEAM